MTLKSFSYTNGTSSMNTKQRSKSSPVEVANPYWLKLRYTYIKCEDCKSILSIEHWMDFTHTYTKCDYCKSKLSTKKRCKATPVKVANPYCLKLRHTYSKCGDCKSIIPYPNLRLLHIIKKEKISTCQRIWNTLGLVICEECSYWNRPLCQANP